MRVLRGGARLAVCVWAAPEQVPLFGIRMDELSRYFPDQRAVLYQPSALADGDTLERLLAGAGLNAIRLTRETRAHRFTSFEEYWQPFEAGGGTPRAIVPETPRRCTAGRARRCAKTDGAVPRTR